MRELVFSCLLLFAFSGCSSSRPPASHEVTYYSPPPSSPSPSRHEYTPPPKQAPEVTTPLSKKKSALVFLDAGHGGRDIGAESKGRRKLQEKMLTLETTKNIEKFLLEWGYHVSMSRHQDAFVALPRRVEMAKQRQADLFVSIHFNSAPNTSIRGPEVFYFQSGKNRQRTLLSRRLGKMILGRLSEVLAIPTRGLKHGDFCVVRETAMPAVLVEVAFITNPMEERLLATKEYKRQLAWAVAKGVDDYLLSKKLVPGAN